MILESRVSFMAAVKRKGFGVVMVALAQNLKTICMHKYYLFVSGRELGVSTWRIIKHDWSKLTPLEFWEYTKKFKLGIDDPCGWSAAWQHHIAHNDHHIEHWTQRALLNGWLGPSINPKVVEEYGCWMPDEAIRETIADWVAASLAYSGEHPVAGKWMWANENLVRKLKDVCTDMQPEISARHGFLEILHHHNLITDGQYREVWMHGMNAKSTPTGAL